MSATGLEDIAHSPVTSPVRRDPHNLAERSFIPASRHRPPGKCIEKFRDEFSSHLKIGSSYYIGTLSRNLPKSHLWSSAGQSKQQCLRNPHSTSTSAAFLRHPLNLVLAREQGDIGPSHKLARRLRYQASRWRVESRSARHVGLQVYGEKSFEPIHSDPQTFQELIQGSLWSVSRLNLDTKFECHGGCVNALQFNSTGNWIASGSDDLEIAITDWAAREQVAKFNTGHTQNIFHVKFLPESNDTRLVSCACDSEVRLAQLASDGSLVGGSTRLLVAHDEACHKLSLPVGEVSTVLSAGADGRVYSIDVRAPRANCILHLPRSEFFSISSHPVKPHEIALGGKSEAIVRIYDRRNMDASDPRKGYLHYFGADDVMKRRRQADAALSRRSTQYSPEASRSALGDPWHSATDSTDSTSSSATELDDTSSNLFNSFSAQLGRQIREERRRTRHRWRLHRTRSRQGTGAVDAHPRGLVIDGASYQKSDYCVTSAQYSAQGDVLLASYNDDDIYLFNVQRPSERYIHKYAGHRNMPTIVSATFFGPNSEFIVSGSDDGFFYVWDRESEGVVQWLFADAIGAVNVVESHPTLPVLASAGLDYDYKLWTPIRPLEKEPYYEYQSIASRGLSESGRLRDSALEQYLFPDSARGTPEPQQQPQQEEVGAIQSQEIRRSDSPPGTSSGAMELDTLPATATSFTSTRKRPHQSSVSRSPSRGVEPIACPLPLSSSPVRSPNCAGSESTPPPHWRLASGAAAEGDDDESAAAAAAKLPKRQDCLETRLQATCKQQQQPCCSSAVSCGDGHQGDRDDDDDDDASSTERLCAVSNGHMQLVPPSPSPSSTTAQLANRVATSSSQLMRPPQSLVPFKFRDLELRVARNWCNRLNERSLTETIDPLLLFIVEDVAEPAPRIPLRWMTPALEALWSDSVRSRDRDETAAGSSTDTSSSSNADDDAVVVVVASSQDLRGRSPDVLDYDNDSDGSEEAEEGMETNSSQTTLSSISSFSEPDLL